MIALLLLCAACDNPTRGKPKAEVSSASPATPATAPATGAGETLNVTTAGSTIGFKASKVTRSHDGSFKRFSGQAQLVGGKPEGGKVTIDIELDSVETDAEKLTGHLKSPDFFDVQKYPKAHFESTSITPGGAAGATHTVSGVLDLHGVKKTITFPATISVAPKEVRVKSEFALNRKEFGIAYPGAPDDLIRDEVLMKLDLGLPRG
jgi:polyisoprenoid-binding protein YceI